jgi:hypothetical protein
MIIDKEQLNTPSRSKLLSLFYLYLQEETPQGLFDDHGLG